MACYTWHEVVRNQHSSKTAAGSFSLRIVGMGEIKWEDILSSYWTRPRTLLCNLVAAAHLGECDCFTAYVTK